MLYDPFQKEAIDYINQGYSVIVSAPTGAGKTAIAEHIINESIIQEQGVIYTAPIKTLSNQKFRDFQARFNENVGILTGDVSLNPHAHILIMTTEIFRNKILDEPESLSKYHWVIFDEIHYIDNPERGTVWEESLIFMPPHIKILALSATIPNIKQFALWIETIHKKPIKVVIEDKRPVPLHFFFQSNNEVVDNLNKVKKSFHGRPNKLNTLINYIRRKDGLPCIYFVFGRRRAEDLAYELYSHNFLNTEERNAIIELYDSLCKRFDLIHEKSSISMQPLIQNGIAFHHAGMLPTLKEVIERLFTSRLLKVIFTTETFALGINMPSRSVIFDDLRKFYGRYVRNLKTRDFYQMAGRAGRRGIDKEGFIYCRINPHKISINEVKQIIYSRPEEVRSQLNNSYATILNLYEIYKDNIFKIYPYSLHYFQGRKNDQKEALRLIEAKLRLLHDFGYIKNNEITDKGEFAKNVYGYELILSELYMQGYLEKFSNTELGIICSAVVFEPRKNQRLPRLSNNVKQIKTICEQLYAEIRYAEQKLKIYPYSKLPYFNLSPSIEAWISGENFQKTLQLGDTDEGEIIRYFRMSVQILREINKAKISSNSLKQKTSQTIQSLNRDIIDAEKQLRS
ncbi:MAG: DEAD/DEAH box helicase [Candidatus Omnitrophota bacterium]